MPAFRIDELKLSLPDWRDEEERWESAMRDCPAIEEVPLRLQMELAVALAGVAEQQPSSSVLGWLILWSRTFHCLNAVRGATYSRSLVSASTTQRTAMETQLHLSAISRITLRRQAKITLSRKARRLRASERLSTYFAWCVWSDLKYWRRLLRPSALGWLFDPRPNRQFVTQYADLLPRLGVLAPEIETLTDAEAKRERTDFVAVAQSKVEWLEAWEQDPSVRRHVDDFKQRRPKSFFATLDETESSVAEFLRNIGMGPGHLGYSRDSAVSHGSTLNRFLVHDGQAVAVGLYLSDEEVARATQPALGYLRGCILTLADLSVDLEWYRNGGRLRTDRDD